MPLYLLDTDHVSLIQRGEQKVSARFQAASETGVVVSVVSYEEQLRGRLVVLSQAKTAEQLSRAYLRLREMQNFFCTLRMIDFDERANAIQDSLRQKHRRAGRMDLRIAATALAVNATLVTRNTQDFDGIENLKIENRA